MNGQWNELRSKEIKASQWINQAWASIQQRQKHVGKTGPSCKFCMKPNNCVHAFELSASSSKKYRDPGLKCPGIDSTPLVCVPPTGGSMVSTKMKREMLLPSTLTLEINLGISVVIQWIKLLRGTHTFHIGVPGWSPNYSVLNPASWSSDSVRQQVLAQLLESLPPVWVFQLEFQAPGYKVAQPWLLWAFGDDSVCGRSQSPVCVCCSNFKIKS